MTQPDNLRTLLYFWAATFRTVLYTHYLCEKAQCSSKKNLLVTSLSISALIPFAAMSAPGDTFEIKGGYDYWSTKQKLDDTTIDNSKSLHSYYVGFEHFIPLIPNAKIRSTGVKSNGLNTDYRQTDYIAYYRLLDSNMIGLDFGLNMQHFSDVKDVDWRPAIYGDVEFTIPATPVTLYSTVSASNYDGSKTFDGEAGAKWTLQMGPLDLGIKAGYRVMENTFKENPEHRVDGYYLGTELKF